MYFFTPIAFDNIEEYCQYAKITEVFPNNSVGIVSGRDKLVFDFDRDNLRIKINEFSDLSKNDSQIKSKYLKKNDTLPLKKVRKEVNALKSQFEKLLTTCFFSPFDVRSLFYYNSVLERDRNKLMRQFIGKENLGLIVPRKVVNDFHHVFVSKYITAFNSLDSAGSFGAGYLFPLYLYPTEKKSLFDEDIQTRQPNFSNEFVGELFNKLKTSYRPELMNELPPKDYPHLASKDSLSVSPEDIFYYIYAVFHSPAYRARYAEFLKIDFPRVPLTSNFSLFYKLARLGEKLVELHLLEKEIETDVTFPVRGSDIVEFAPKYENGKVKINKEQYFDNVPEDAWNFHIGGYQVLHKWLKDRKDRKLSFEDLEHYSKIVSALSQTIELMQNIDAAIEAEGGFPIT